MINAIDLRNADLNLMVVFAVLFHERSVKRAAQQLFVGQSTVSMALARLRRLFGDALFVKVADGVEPTSRAVAIEPRIRQALELLRCAVHDVSEFAPETSQRVIRVALSDDLGLWLLPALLDAVRREAPGVVLVIRTSNWYSGLGLLEQEDADLALGLFPAPGTAYFRQKLLRQRFLTVFDAAHLSGTLTRRRFLAAPHALVSFRGDLIGPVDEALREQGATRNVVVTVPSFELLGPLIRGRDLLSTLPESAARAIATTYALAVAPPPIDVPEYDVAMLWHARSARDPALAWLRKRIKAVIDEHAFASTAPSATATSVLRQRKKRRPALRMR